MTMASKRASYTAALKLKVIETADKCGNRAAGREYSVNEKLVRDWRKKKAELEALPRGKRSLTNISWKMHARTTGAFELDRSNSVAHRALREPATYTPGFK